MKQLTFIIYFVFLICFGAYAENIEENKVKIKITFNENVIIAELNNSAPAKDLLSKLPKTIHFNKHQNREFYTNLLLDKMGDTQDDYQVGDIAYWTTGNSLVLFYEAGYTNDLIIMGHITKGLNLLKDANDIIDMKIEVFEN